MCIKWQVVIRKVDDGGYSVTYKGGEEVDTEKVYSISEDSEKKHFVEMLWDIIDFFGEYGNKHDKVRVNVGYRLNNEAIGSKEALKALKKALDIVD